MDSRNGELEHPPLGIHRQEGKIVIDSSQVCMQVMQIDDHNHCKPNENNPKAPAAHLEAWQQEQHPCSQQNGPHQIQKRVPILHHVSRGQRPVQASLASGGKLHHLREPILDTFKEQPTATLTISGFMNKKPLYETRQSMKNARLQGQFVRNARGI